MYYDDEQVNRMIHDLQYIGIAKEKNATNFIAKLLRDGEELHEILHAYPLVRYEPLDYHYVLLKYLGVWNQELLTDLCSGHYTWRGIVAACWLTCLRPLTGCEDALCNALTRTPSDNKWLVLLALAEVRSEPYLNGQSLQRSIQNLRQLLSKVKQPNFSLRPALSAVEIEQLFMERNQILAAYRTGGHSAAKLALVGTLTQQRRAAI